MKITDMPGDLLVAIMCAAGQPARVQSMVACKALCRAATDTGAWDSIVFGDLDMSAVRFMMRHRCASVTVRTNTPDDISWFLGRLADHGCGDCIRELSLEVGPTQRLPEDLLCAVARHTGLRAFSLFIADCELICELVWPRTGRLFDLRTMTIVEGDTKNVVVWFSGSQSRFPALEDVVIDVGMTDILAGVCHMPRLSRLVYHCDVDEGGETLEDVCLTGVELDVLELDITEASETRHLFRQLEQCTVRRLVLHVHDEFLELSRPLSPALEELVIGMHVTHADISIAYPYLARYKKLRLLQLEVASPRIRETQMQDCCHRIVFQEGTWPECMQLFARVRLDVLVATTGVAVSPIPTLI